MGIFGGLRKTPIGGAMRAKIKRDAVGTLISGQGQVDTAFHELFALFRTDLTDHPLNRDLNIHTSADRENIVLTFYAAVVIAMVQKYKSLQFIAPAGWFAMYLIRYAGVGRDEAAQMGYDHVEQVKQLEKIANAGAVALHVWLLGDVEQAALIFRGLAELF